LPTFPACAKIAAGKFSFPAMNLFILRHGIAANPGEEGLPKNAKDAERPLSREGQKKTWRATEAMRSLDLKFDAVVTSPLLRARQTAQIVAEALELRRKLIFSDHLKPDGSPKLLLEQLDEIGGRAKNILLVGHEPYLSRLVSLLISGSTLAAVELKKGALLKLEVRHLGYARCATLAWSLPPKLLGRIEK
jgi:phosphohistidine phosphatase